MQLIVGLGNPGKKYEKTRHNAGFLVVDELHRRLSFPPYENKFEGEFSRGKMHGNTVMLLKPQTFMNHSGSSVLQAVQFYKLSAATDLWLVYDDIDLPLGTIRIREEGSAGGHRGVESIIERLASGDFNRFRVGIGRPVGRVPIDKYVVKPFGLTEKKKAKEAIVRTADAVEDAIRNGMTHAMNAYNN